MSESAMNDGTASAPLLRVVPKTGLAPRTGVERRPIVMVLGMHRSGTSLCSHVLSALGVDMADRLSHPSLPGPAPDNPKGHWERWEIVQFHERILKLFNRDYRSGFHDFSLPVAWWADPRVAELRRELTAFLKARMVNDAFGFKDPRTVRLMPIWYQVLNELKLTPKIVYCLRNPAQVARSLHARDGLNLDAGEYRWFTYNADFFHYIRELEYCTIEYESWFEKPAANLAKLLAFLDLPERQDRLDIDLAVSEIVDEELRHDDAYQSEARQPLLRSLYKAARHADDDRTARGQLQTIAAQFRAFRQLQGTFERGFEQNAESATKLPALEQEAATLRGSITDREAQLEAVRAEARQSAKDAEETLAELERERARVTELRKEREHIAAALERARSSLTQRDGRVAEIEAVSAERVAAIEALQAKNATLHETLEEARREGQGSKATVAAIQAALAESLAAPRVLQVEIDRLRGELAAVEQAVISLQNEFDPPAAVPARTEQEAPGVARATAEMNLARLRESVAQLIRDSEARVTGAQILENEVETLKIALSDAEETARAAMQALAKPISPAVYREPPLGWRQTIRRLLGLARIT